MRYLRVLLIVVVLAWFCFPAYCEEGKNKAADLNREALLTDIPECVKIMGGEDRLDAVSCTFKIRKLGEPAIKEIVKFLDNPDKTTRVGAVRALSAPRMKQWIIPYFPKLAGLLKDKEFEVRYYCLQTLGGLEAKELVPDIKQLLNDADEVIRAKAKMTLAEIGEAEYYPDVIAIVKSGDPYLSLLREDAAEILIKRRVKEAIPVLLEILITETEKRVKRARPKLEKAGDLYDMIGSGFFFGDLVDAMGDLNVKEAIPILQKLVKSEELGGAVRAIFALAKLGDKSVLPDLIIVLKSETRWHRATAAELLGKLGAKEAGKDLAALFADKDADVRLKSLQALMALNAKELSSEVMKLLKDPDRKLRMNALHVLGSWDVKDAIPEVAGLLKDPDSSVRINVVLSLGKLNARDKAAAIADCLQDTSMLVRGVAAIVLVEWGIKDKVPAKHTEDVNAVIKANWGDSYNNRAKAVLKDLGATPAAEAPKEAQK